MRVILLLLPVLQAFQRNGWIATAYTFALVPKSVDNPFFDVARDGCVDQAAILGITCLYTGPPANSEDADGRLQAQMVSELIETGAIDGLAISVRRADIIAPVIEQAVRAGIPVVTFDSDAPDSKRTAYIGTDNFFFGVQLAKALKQLVPSGGTYGMLGTKAPNLMERMQGFEQEINEDGRWTPVEGSPSDTQANLTLAVEQMYAFAELNATAIAPTMGAPMRSGLWKEFVDRNRVRNLTLVSGDAMPNQLEFLDRGYVQGLVGQLPYEMGFTAIQVLYDLVQGGSVDEGIIGTNVLTHILVPLVLPKLVIDDNLIGNLHIVGFILFALVACMAIGFAVWTYRSRNIRVVKVSQPLFLVTIAMGVLVMACSLVPLSFDDKGDPESQSDREGALICMSVPWLAFCGFTITFSALFSKTKRINMIFHSRVPFGRLKVTVRDVMLPFAALLTANIVVLMCWTILDPLVYVREAHPGTDGWNRVISTYGSCQSENAQQYLIPLAVVNVSVLVIANWQAYVSRLLESEFSESKYIGMTMASLLQATLSGVPILFVVRDSPQAFYLVLIFMIFVVCMAVLLLIFVPKVVLADAFSQRSDLEQQQLLFRSIHLSSGQSSHFNRSSGSYSVPGDASGPFAGRALDGQNAILTRIEESNESASNRSRNRASELCRVRGGDNEEGTDDDDAKGMKVVRTDEYGRRSVASAFAEEEEEEAPKISSVEEANNENVDDVADQTDIGTQSGGEDEGESDVQGDTV